MKSVSTSVGNIVILNQADIVDAIESIFNSSKINELVEVAQGNNVSQDVAINNVAELLMHYVCSTGDKSESKLNNIMQDCIDNIELLNNRTYIGITYPVNKKQKLFEKTVYQHIEKYWRKKLNISGNSLEDIEKITTAVTTQCFNNKFRTHSFNGALVDIVEKEGLDISREMFAEEYRILSKISKTPYSKGELYFCELGAGTFGYMHRSPERFWLTLDGGLKRGENEDVKDYAIRNFEELLRKHQPNLTKEEFVQIYNAGIKMINFYCSSPEVGVAVIKLSENITDDCDTSSWIVLKIKTLLSRIPLKQKIKLPKDFETALNKIPNNKEGLIQLSSMLNQYQQIDEELKNVIEETKVKTMQIVMEESSLNNFSYEGNVDGYRVVGGKLARKDFGLAIVVDPVLQTTHNKENTIQV